MELTSLQDIRISEGWIRVNGPAARANEARLREAACLAAPAKVESFEARLPRYELDAELVGFLRKKGVQLPASGQVEHLSPGNWPGQRVRPAENFHQLVRGFQLLGVSIEGVAVPSDLLPFLRRRGPSFMNLEPQALLEALDLLTCYRGEGFAVFVARA